MSGRIVHPSCYNLDQSFIHQPKYIVYHFSAEKCQKMKLNIESKKERKPIGVTTTTTKKMYVAISKPKMTIRYHVFKNIKNRSENST